MGHGIEASACARRRRQKPKNGRNGTIRNRKTALNGLKILMEALTGKVVPFLPFLPWSRHRKTVVPCRRLRGVWAQFNVVTA